MFGSSEFLSYSFDEAESITMIREAYNAGINYFDTADIYCNGESERVLGKALKNVPRQKVVIATKLGFPVKSSPKEGPTGVREALERPEWVNCYGLSRKHIFDAVEASLKRLGVDYIDLYQMHRFDPVSQSPFDI